MKRIGFAVLMAITSSAAMAVDRNYSCFYQPNDRVSLAIFGRPNKKFIVYDSRKAGTPIRIDDVEDHGDRLTGSLPSPWADGTTYEIEIRQGTPFHSIKYIGPDKVHTVSFDLVCNEF